MSRSRSRSTSFSSCIIQDSSLDEELIEEFVSRRQEYPHSGTDAERKHWRIYMTNLGFECTSCVKRGEACQLNENPKRAPCQSCIERQTGNQRIPCSHMENFCRWRVRFRAGRISEDMYNKLEAECQRRGLLDKGAPPDIGVRTVKQDPGSLSQTFPSTQTQQQHLPARTGPTSESCANCGNTSVGNDLIFYDLDSGMICEDCYEYEAKHKTSKPKSKYINLDSDNDVEEGSSTLPSLSSRRKSKRESKEPSLSWSSTPSVPLPRRQRRKTAEHDSRDTWAQKDEEYRQQITELKGTIRELRQRLEQEMLKNSHNTATSSDGLKPILPPPLHSSSSSSFLSELASDVNSQHASYIRSEYSNVSVMQDVFSSALMDYDEGTLSADGLIRECKSHDKDLASLRRRLRLSVQPAGKRSREAVEGSGEVGLLPSMSKRTRM